MREKAITRSATQQRGALAWWGRKRSRQVTVGIGAVALVSLSLVSLSLAIAPTSYAVVGGPLVNPAPSWMALVTGAQDACTGVLVTRDLVLTAKHCNVTTSSRVMVGKTDAEAPAADPSQDPQPIKAVFPYPGPEDLVLGQLATPLPRAPLALGTNDVHLTIQPFTLFGYGDTTDHGQPPVTDWRLRSVGGESTPCTTAILAEEPAGHFCARSITPTHAPCDGDSGAPILDRGGYLEGLYSAGFGIPNVTPCVGEIWIIVSLTYPPVHDWLTAKLNDPSL